MKLPAKITVGPLVYRVICDLNAINAAQVSAQQGLYGETDIGQLVITINPQAAPARRRSTLLHEALHAVWYFMGLDKSFSTEQEENAVNALSEGLLDTLRRNPGLVRYLLEVE